MQKLLERFPQTKPGMKLVGSAYFFLLFLSTIMG